MIERRVAVAVCLLGFWAVALGADSCSTETKNTADQPGGKSPKKAALGDPITLKGTDTTMKVTPLRLLDPAPAGPYDQPTQQGARFVGIEVELANTGDSTYSDSPSNGAQIITASDEQADATLLTSGPCGGSFSSDTTIAPGSIRKGCIPFELRRGQKPATFQFALDSGFGPQSGEWGLR